MSGYFSLSLKRTLRTVYFPVMLVVFSIVTYFAPSLGASEDLLPAGLCNNDTSEISARIVEYLLDNGYELCSDEAELTDGIESGRYSCGAVIPNGFGALVSELNADGAIKFIVTPVSYAPEIYQNHIAAIVYREAAPYITAAALDETDITFDEVYEKYVGMSEDGVLFSFDEQLSEGNVRHEAEREKTYTLTAVSLLIFALIMYSASDVFTSDIPSLAPRIGIRKTVVTAVIPDVFARLFGVNAAYIVSAHLRLWLCSDDLLVALIPIVFVYSILTVAFGIFAVTIFAGREKTSACTFYLLVLSLVLCPIYFDIELVLPALGKLRLFLPTYWLWLLDGKDSTVFAFFVAIFCFFASFLLMLLKFKPQKICETVK